MQVAGSQLLSWRQPSTHTQTHTHREKREETQCSILFPCYIYFSVEVGQVERALSSSSSTAAVIRRIFFFFFSNNKKKELTIDFSVGCEKVVTKLRERERPFSSFRIRALLFQFIQLYSRFGSSVVPPPPLPLPPTDQRLLIKNNQETDSV